MFRLITFNISYKTGKTSFGRISQSKLELLRNKRCYSDIYSSSSRRHTREENVLSSFFYYHQRRSISEQLQGNPPDEMKGNSYRGRTPQRIRDSRAIPVKRRRKVGPPTSKESIHIRDYQTRFQAKVSPQMCKTHVYGVSYGYCQDLNKFTEV